MGLHPMGLKCYLDDLSPLAAKCCSHQPAFNGCSMWPKQVRSSANGLKNYSVAKTIEGSG